MKEIVRFGLTMVLGLGVMVPGAMITAQDDAWTCDEGPNDIVTAAEAIKDEASDLEEDARMAKLKEAYWLAAQAEALCASDPDGFRDARRLRRNLESRLNNLRAFTYEPGYVDLGEYKLFIECVGEGSPTVIFENGFLTNRTEWEDVHPAISTLTRACIYDRLGLGLSGSVPPDTIRTTQDQVDDLVNLLEQATIEPPYIVVGHSWGGAIDLLFTHQNPERVQGVVLVDVVHPDQYERIEKAFFPEDIEALRPEKPINTEHLDFDASNAEIATIRSYGDRPLAIVTAGRPGIGFAPEAFELWHELQADYLTYSTNSRQVIAERSTHYVMNTQPELIIEMIEWVLDEARAAE